MLLADVYRGVFYEVMMGVALRAMVVVPAFFVLVLLALLVLLWAVLRWRKGLELPPTPWVQLVIVAAGLVLTAGLLVVGVPRRLAFRLSRPAFEEVLQEARSSPGGMLDVDRWLGIYEVDECAVDERGGVYFRTYECQAGIWVDRMSFGFVHEPNEEGSPFGAADYHGYRVSGDWYVFEANDDWY